MSKVLLRRRRRLERDRRRPSLPPPQPVHCAGCGNPVGPGAVRRGGYAYCDFGCAYAGC